jgi:AcrR family transcriptional regulator
MKQDIEKKALSHSRPKAGRPTREQAEQRHEELLDHALDIFLDNGFERSTIEAIAASVGMTKRTVYARYEDKTALFKAALQRAIDRWNLRYEEMQSEVVGDLEEMLTRIARSRIALVMTPEGLKLQRILNTESYRFPDIFTMAYARASQSVIGHLIALFRHHEETGELATGDPVRAATSFMSMVVGGPTRQIVSGNYMSQKEIEEHLRFSVRLFLNGARTR